MLEAEEEPHNVAVSVLRAADMMKNAPFTAVRT